MFVNIINEVIDSNPLVFFNSYYEKIGTIENLYDYFDVKNRLIKAEGKLTQKLLNMNFKLKSIPFNFNKIDSSNF